MDICAKLRNCFSQPTQNPSEQRIDPSERLFAPIPNPHRVDELLLGWLQYLLQPDVQLSFHGDVKQVRELIVQCIQRRQERMRRERLICLRAISFRETIFIGAERKCHPHWTKLWNGFHVPNHIAHNGKGSSMDAL
eukprot:CAMPEP_0117054484 /NCGR_PEP_ID=MMETSP0472-20121206/37759_1 /TAXON_ID=693140 ORGANISM="Tiarina fusus, Strain LIS" /NCGR_SAMPLE_ID=MMETSP0472 /ASSEMBLY_ACC=CAM_ASM_000603 /LENGTH=135 /DNA_ID=CAMNT_0004770089 /DNA_START=142 /DNA_END=546 /DNA_ORIENTATION=+